MSGHSPPADNRHRAHAGELPRDTPHDRRPPGRRLATDKNQLLRLPSFLGCVILLYAVASGLSGQDSAAAGASAGISQHGVAGIIGTVLCVIGIILLSRRRTL
jgi:hypothetical protein